MKKLKNDSGSALILALFLMVLVSTIIVSFSNQVTSQIRSTINLDESIQEKYNKESYIENFIADFIKNIEVRHKDSTYIPQGKLHEICGNYKLYYNKSSNIHIDIQKTGDSIVNFIINIKVDDEESKIKIRVSNIDGENKYNIDYEVESWRERKIGADSLNE